VSENVDWIHLAHDAIHSLHFCEHDIESSDSVIAE